MAKKIVDHLEFKKEHLHLLEAYVDGFNLLHLLIENEKTE